MDGISFVYVAYYDVARDELVSRIMSPGVYKRFVFRRHHPLQLKFNPQRLP
jgi:hypothetical protein